MAGREELVVESEVVGDGATVTVRGELDLASKPTLMKEFEAVLARGAVRVVVDLSGVSFIDSTGVGVFLEVRRRGAEVSLLNPKGRVRALLELVMIDGLVPIEYGPG